MERKAKAKSKSPKGRLAPKQQLLLQPSPLLREPFWRCRQCQEPKITRNVLDSARMETSNHGDGASSLQGAGGDLAS